MSTTITASAPLATSTTRAPAADEALGREVLLCHRKGPAKVFAIAGFALAAITVIFMGLLALDSGAATGSDFIFLGVIAAIFGATGMAFHAYRQHVDRLRQVLRVHERGVVREDRRGRTVLVHFAEVSKVDASVLNTVIMSTLIVSLRTRKRLRTVFSSQRYDGVNDHFLATVRELVVRAGGAA